MTADSTFAASIINCLRDRQDEIPRLLRFLYIFFNLFIAFCHLQQRTNIEQDVVECFFIASFNKTVMYLSMKTFFSWNVCVFFFNELFWLIKQFQTELV